MAEMDPQIQRIVESVDPDVPFCASRQHLHHTWAKTFFSRPELYIQPHSLPEIQKILKLARRCRRRIVVVGSAHSPSDLTCTSSWLVNLDNFAKILDIDQSNGFVTVQAGIRLHELGQRLKEYGLTLPNIGSIDEQSIAGVISTASHGSSLRHGLLSSCITQLRLCLANGQEITCSPEKNASLFSAALVSLGALGVITEVTIQAVPSFNVKWSETLYSLSHVLETWQTTLWSSAEYTRVWWFPYTKSAIIWRADKTSSPALPKKSSRIGSWLGFHMYQLALYVSNWIPRILPYVERFALRVQYGHPASLKKTPLTTTGIEDSRTGLLLDCLYSQFVNEWAIPLSKGPEALTRLGAWINHEDSENHHIPLPNDGVYVHAPIEVRVINTTQSSPRPFLDPTQTTEPTLYLNATLYRPYKSNPPCTTAYYKAFEFLMKELGGRPHWAKNFDSVDREAIESMYGSSLQEWRKVRADVDPDGMFSGAWHRRFVLSQNEQLAMEEREGDMSRSKKVEGGIFWEGVAVSGTGDEALEEEEEDQGSQALEGRKLQGSSSVESFDIMAGAEASMIISHQDEASDAADAADADAMDASESG